MKITTSLIALAAGMVAAPLAAAPEIIGITRAVAIAEHALGARAVDAELELAPQGAVYEIGLVRGSALHEARVDARTGRFLGATQPRLKNAWRRWFASKEMARAAKGPPLADLLARLERQTSGKVREVEFETEDGRAWYDVEIATAAGVAEVRLDPASGERLAALYDD